jgi:hypothetical protein
LKKTKTALNIDKTVYQALVSFDWAGRKNGKTTREDGLIHYRPLSVPIDYYLGLGLVTCDALRKVDITECR